MERFSPPEDLDRFRLSLLRWWQESRRDLPWRRTADPYAILVSEVLLQQTRVDQALGYYERFLTAFPDFAALARASEEEVLRVWAGAGYYRRARNLHRLARVVSAEELPRTAAGLEELPGIGPYTAAAVASIAFGEPIAAVDGNVRRVLARLWAEERPRAKWLREAAQLLLDPGDPGRWNQAMMELGSTLCTPKDPRCAACPIAEFCAGKPDAERYPLPRARSQRAVTAVTLVLRGENGFFLERRDGQALGGLWGVPLAEGQGALRNLLDLYRVSDARRIGTVRHSFTHKRLTIAVYAADWDGPVENPSSRPLSVLDQKILKLAEALDP